MERKTWLPLVLMLVFAASRWPGMLPENFSAAHALLFCAAFFAIGVIDEFAVDLSYVWMRLRGRIATPKIDESQLTENPLAGRAAVFVPAWQEAAVIGPTIYHMLEVWPYRALWIYVGCYHNDPPNDGFGHGGCA